VYEKNAARRINALFNPKGTIQKLKEGNSPEYLDEEGRRDLIRQYLDVSGKFSFKFFYITVQNIINLFMVLYILHTRCQFKRIRLAKYAIHTWLHTLV
jgi:hypothetical protein